MRKILFSAIAVIIIFSGPSVVAEDELNALDYIPPNQFISGWVAAGNEVFDRPENLGWLLGDGLFLLLEYEPVWFATESYERGADLMTVEIYQFENVSDAFGFYSVSNAAFVELNPGPNEVNKPYDPPPASEFDTIRIINGEYIEGFQDTFYFRIQVIEEELHDTGIRAGLYMQGRLPGASIPAPMTGILPADNRVRGSERYLKGELGLDLLTAWTGYDFLGFREYDWKAVAAEYRVSSGYYYLLMITEYDDNDTAGIAADRLQDYFEDQYWETVMVPPMANGIHPRAFENESFAAFWSKGNQLWLIWDCGSQSKLTDAITQHER